MSRNKREALVSIELISASLDFPKNRAQIMHIFAAREGHVPDTPENRKLIKDTANNPANFVGRDKDGVSWYAKERPDGSQIWVKTLRGIIRDAGLNKKPRPWDPETGFYQNPKKKGGKKK